jgi:predicted metalloprotease with PDZ domain
MSSFIQWQQRGGVPVIQKILIAFCLLWVAQPAFAGARGYLGAWFGVLPANEKTVRTGVVMNKVFAGSAAQQAGLKPGQIVTKIDGVFVRDPKTAVSLLAANSAGEKVSLTVIDRAGGDIRPSHVVATLADAPPDGFAEVMTARPVHPPRRLPPSSGACHSHAAVPCPDGASASPR